MNTRLTSNGLSAKTSLTVKGKHDLMKCQDTGFDRL